MSCVSGIKEARQPDSRDWYFEDATVQAAIELTRELMEKYSIPADHVIRHYDVTGKICPNPYVYNHTSHTWDVFKAAITGEETMWEYQTISTDTAQVEVTAPPWSSVTHQAVKIPEEDTIRGTE